MTVDIVEKAPHLEHVKLEAFGCTPSDGLQILTALLKSPTLTHIKTLKLGIN